MDIRGHDFVERTCKAEGIAVQVHPAHVASKVRESVLHRYGSPSNRSELWESLGDLPSVQDAHAYMRLGSWLPPDAILFFDARKEPLAFQFSSGPAFVYAINVLCVHTFYASCENVDYVLAFHDHDFVIGGGRAESWVRIHRLMAEAVAP